MIELSPLKHLASVRIVNGVGEAAEFDNPDWPRYVRTTDIGSPRSLRTDTFKSLPPEIASRAPLEDGDIVMTAAGATIGKSLLYSSPKPACYAGYLVRFRPKHGVDSRFIAYWMESHHYWDQISTGKVVSTIENFSAGKYQSLRCPSPPPSAQRAIADYLDIETARIDALTEKKQRMIEALDERFRAEGRQLITGGSPTSVRSPGAAWAGPVPLGWSAYKIASFARLSSGTTPPSDVSDYYSDEGTAWVTTAELREREITTTARCVTDLALRDCSALKVFPPGTVLVAMYGATVGRVGVLGMPAATNQACCAIYGASPRLDLKFVYWWLVLNRQHLLDMACGAGQPNISQETIRSLRVPAPGLDDQQSIAAKLDHLHARTAKRRAVLECQIELLREHRQALITAAVTGELEIPGVAA